ncbi:hypothetical protein SpiGrapes_2423 [Sphaerochaeta pleomorpha str. Grapes]|uniref:Uncharacterized protein n=1 Tax=Sphaerochaeta pleomorpha (strain ATCC BAA-1885 / DSM 22778 / Grapes) TaxID=158190 RepID=G8QTF2_SPHPG|nr:hypothetical protein [Sphaerochaeta pleomorpha]AEV30193.1 hypothetical protein SpiGrapes_2423 [Sphaerochaeta pleomorpha str. Grapes]
MKHTIDFCFAPDINQTCIGLVDDKYKTIVREDGSLNYLWESDKNEIVDGTIPPFRKRILDNQEGNMAFKYRFLPRFSHRDSFVERTQDFGDPSMAIVTTVERFTDTVFSWKTFAYENSDGLRMDIILYRLETSVDFGHALTTVYLQELGDHCDSPSAQRFQSGAYTLPVGVARIPAPIAYATEGGSGIIAASEVWEGAFGILYAGNLKEDEFTLEFAKNALAWCKGYWNSVKPFLKAFRVPDQSVQNMLLSCGRNILQAQELVDTVKEFHVGPTIYRGLWVVDGYYFAECAYMMGREDEAFSLLLGILRNQKPDGSIRILPDHHKETAVAISNIVRQCELHNDDERLRELWPTIMRGMLHLRSMRDDSLKLGSDYPACGMFPPSFGDGGIYGPEPEYTTPMNVILGMQDAYRAGFRLGLEGAQEIKDFSDELMDVMMKAISRDTTKTAEGIPYLPLSMDKTRDYKPQAGIQTIARVAFHEEFATDSEIVRNLFTLIDSIDDEEGIPYGTGWRPDQSLYTYSSVRFAQLMVACGMPDKAVDYLYAFANHASASRVWREEQPLKSKHSSEVCGDMPHNWASVEFIRLVRNMVLLERNEGIHLLPVLPDEWLPTYEHDLMFEKTPTKFGEIDLHLEYEGPGSYLLEFRRGKGNQKPSFVNLTWKGEIGNMPEGFEKIGDHAWAIDPELYSFSCILYMPGC